MHWMKAEKSITIPDLGAKPSQWVIFNIQETGIPHSFFLYPSFLEFLSTLNLL